MLNNKFLKNIITLISGTSAGQLLLLLLSPILTRLYSTDDFGAFGVFMSASTILLVIASLKYEMALPIVKSRNAVSALVKLCVLLICVLSLLTFLVVIAMQQPLAELLNIEQHKEVLYLLPAALFVCGLYQLANYYCVREASFSRLSISKVVQATSIGLGQVSLSVASTLGLIYGYVAGFALSLLCFLPFLKGKKIKLKSDTHKMLAVSKRYVKFPKYTMWASLTNTSGTVLPVIMFSSFYSASLAGLYVLAHRVLIAPVNIIGSAISSVFMSNARKYKEDGELSNKTFEIHKQLINFSMPLLALFVFYLPELFGFIFGEQWSKAGQLSSFLAVWIYFVFTASPISTVLIVLEKQKLAANFDFVSFVIRVSAVAGLSVLPFTDAIMYFAILNGFIVFAFISMTFRQLYVPLSTVAFLHIKSVGTYLLPSLCLYALLHDTSKIAAFVLTLIWVVGTLTFKRRKAA